MSTLGFDKYIDPLRVYLAKYRCDPLSHLHSYPNISTFRSSQFAALNILHMHALLLR